MRTGEVLAIALLERDNYKEELVEDEFDKRWFYYYNEATVAECLGEAFETVNIEHPTLKRKTAKWLVILAKKKRHTR